MSNKKKICFIAQFPPPIHGLSKAVETLYGSELSKEFDFEKINITNNKAFPVNLAKIAKSNADLFYFTISQTRGGNLRDLMILKLLHAQKKKCLVHLHGGYYRQMVEKELSPRQKKANEQEISNLAGAIVLGKSLRRNFEGMLPEEKIFTVANCVDDEFLMSDEEFMEKLSDLRQNEIRHVLYLSNFISSKGYPQLLEMARLEKLRCEQGEPRKFHFDFAGKFFQKQEEEFFFGFVKKHNLEEYVTYHGVVSGNEKRELLRQGAIFGLLTRYPNEGQPISILEAMGNGMVILTTDHAGISDVVRDEENGIVVSGEVDCAAVYRKLCEMTPEKLARTAEENRADVRIFYCQNKYIGAMKQVFTKILNQGT